MAKRCFGNLLIGLAGICCAATLAVADDGDLDATWSGDGLATAVLGDSSDLARALAVQPDGKIVVVGRTDTGGGSGDAFAVIRYLTDGTLDTSFSGDGIRIEDIGLGDDEAWGVAIQSDGKIVVAGCTVPDAEQRLGLVRYLSNGTPDATFGTNGIVTGPSGTCSHSVALQTDGKIVVAGYDNNRSTILTARYTAGGSLDGTFSGDGLATADPGSGNEEAWELAIQDDGKIVVAGCSTVGASEQIVLLRYSSGGIPDATFDADGLVVTDVSGDNDCAHALAIQNDGKIVVAGTADDGTWALLSRYTSSGALDSDFSGDGLDLTRPDSSDAASWGVALHEGGSIVVTGGLAGAEERMFVQRYLPSGSLDPTFGAPDGTISHNWGAFYALGNAIAIQSDGKVVTAGHLGSMSGPVFATARFQSLDGFSDGFESGSADSWSREAP